MRNSLNDSYLLFNYLRRLNEVFNVCLEKIDQNPLSTSNSPYGPSLWRTSRTCLSQFLSLLVSSRVYCLSLDVYWHRFFQGVDLVAFSDS